MLISESLGCMNDLPLESTLENIKEPTYRTRTKATADESVPGTCRVHHDWNL